MVELKEKRKEYRRKYKQKIHDYNVQYNLKNPDYFKKKSKEWRTKNKEKIREYEKIRCCLDVKFKLKKRLRTRLYIALKQNNKNCSAIKDLGCSLQDFIVYMEKLFVENMTWDNYGKWHIDHIIPLSKYDLTDRNQLLEACHFTNLQPLWAEDNQKKSNKIVLESSWPRIPVANPSP